MCVIRLFTFLGEAGSKVLPSTQNGAHQKKGWPLQQTESTSTAMRAVLCQEWKLASGDVAQATAASAAAASAEKILNLAEKSGEMSFTGLRGFETKMH